MPYILIFITYVLVAVAFAVAVEIFLDTTKPFHHWNVLPFERGQFTIRSLLMVTFVVAVCCGLTPWDHVNDIEWKATGPNGYSSQGRITYQPRIDEFGHLTYDWIVEWEE